MSEGSKGNSGLFHMGNKFANKTLWPGTLETGKQGKHIKGHKNYIPGKSELIISMEEAAELVKKYSGTGEVVGKEEISNKERVDFGKIIGYYIDDDGNKYPTTMGIIHHSKKGTHIVPRVPKGGI